MDGFFGISIARRALEASQYGMDVTAHNIANANTPGYSRQRAILAATPSFPYPGYNRPMLQAQLGTGVEVKSVERVRSSYFDSQIRKENQALGGWEVKDDALKQLEAIFNEPSEAGLQNIMGEFWNAWQQLSKNPESLSVRTSVIEMGRTLTSTFNQLDAKLSRLRDNLNDQAAVKVDEVNNIADRIYALNNEIIRIQTFGVEPNDLKDERDKLIDDLSKIADITVGEQDSGATLIFLNGRQLVSEYSANHIQTTPNGLNSGYYDVTWESDGSAVTLYGGEIKSLVDSRDVTIQNYRGDLDTLASTLITEINNLHAAGVGLDGTTGWNFFTGTGAADIALSADIDDPTHVAAATDAAAIPGDNSNALAIGKLKDTLLTIDGNNVTMNDFYRSTVTNLGIESQESGRMITNSKLYYDLIENHRQSVSGVSLDEEATNMIKYQRAYEAAARVITMLDDMLDTLINRMVR
ncbi:MAG: flagellar hook-associated protein FlgK [Candidatus Aquicultor secundus]|nr:MAG: flagellar hook-associated protein FlgK [Candidatus Aquicultor secundus]